MQNGKLLDLSTSGKACGVVLLVSGGRHRATDGRGGPDEDVTMSTRLMAGFDFCVFRSISVLH
jgi:hypothetical protein